MITVSKLLELVRGVEGRTDPNGRVYLVHPSVHVHLAIESIDLSFNSSRYGRPAVGLKCQLDALPTTNVESFAAHLQSLVDTGFGDHVIDPWRGCNGQPQDITTVIASRNSVLLIVDDSEAFQLLWSLPVTEGAIAA